MPQQIQKQYAAWLVQTDAKITASYASEIGRLKSLLSDIVEKQRIQNHLKQIYADGDCLSLPQDQFLFDYWHPADIQTKQRITYVLNQKHDVFSRWTNIVAISAGTWHTVGLKSDGTVVTMGNAQCRKVSHWRNIIAIFTYDIHTVGLTCDGTIVSTEGTAGKVCDGPDALAQLLEEKQSWKRKIEQARLAESFTRRREELTQEKTSLVSKQSRYLQEKHALAQKKTELEAECMSLQKERSNLKGLFTGKRRKELDQKIVDIKQNIVKLERDIRDNEASLASVQQEEKQLDQQLAELEAKLAEVEVLS